MIIGEVTKNAAGIAIFGDYYDLQGIHETIHYLSDSPAISEGSMKDYVLGLAYDFRKAYEMQREEKTFGHDQYDKVKYRGVNVILRSLCSAVYRVRKREEALQGTAGTTQVHVGGVARIYHVPENGGTKGKGAQVQA
jgi:hypothetical protein